MILARSSQSIFRDFRCGMRQSDLALVVKSREHKTCHRANGLPDLMNRESSEFSLLAPKQCADELLAWEQWAALSHQIIH
jgi:hypothetical protein